ncbi:MAG: ABC transporter permease [Propionibacteriales bacterium]|nr:ABC transporter permease [Propionibacteriales bacterium]
MAGDSVSRFWDALFRMPDARNFVNIINNSVVLYLSGLAAAICFRMKLFNIGVEGQYRVAVFAAAVFAGQAWLPGYLNTAVAVLVAMLVGALWAGIAGLLRATRGVSEVISTIMLNSIAGTLVAYLLRQVGERRGETMTTTPLPRDSWVGGIPLIPGEASKVYGFAVLAVLAGVAYWLILNRTRFGFELRATGASQPAALASGVDVKRMVVMAMLLSGAVAGLVGMPLLFGTDHAYASTFQSGIGFTGIAVALLGRNHPIGIALGAIVFSFLIEQSNVLDIVAQVSPDVVVVTQGVIVMSVVIAYEVVRRYRNTAEQRGVARSMGGPSGKQETEGVVA